MSPNKMTNFQHLKLVLSQLNVLYDIQQDENELHIIIPNAPGTHSATFSFKTNSETCSYFSIDGE